ncbi:unnamed protein product, partial [Amoebophrya sp. A120]
GEASKAKRTEEEPDELAELYAKVLDQLQRFELFKQIHPSTAGGASSSSSSSSVPLVPVSQKAEAASEWSSKWLS